LTSLLKLTPEELVEQRYEKYKAIGKVSIENQYIGVN
ncbi:acetyl-CoA carboxylase carboxyl transferase subunit alpha, partial [Bacillus safensis]|nr:acetyl-CoA carboxylase carboxyl transferase subunit alpha [Bacillus safensis]